MLRNLTRNGFTVSAINDIDTTKCGGYTNDIKIARTAREVAQESDVIVTGLPKPPHVRYEQIVEHIPLARVFKSTCIRFRQVFEGPDGLLAGMAKDKVWIDHSTTDSGQNHEFEAALKAKGAFLLEAPITGGLDALRKGQMAVWVAGDKNAFEQVRYYYTILHLTT